MKKGRRQRNPAFFPLKIVIFSNENQMVAVLAAAEQRGVPRQCPAPGGPVRQYGFTTAYYDKALGLV
jgi:hypothetical protein